MILTYTEYMKENVSDKELKKVKVVQDDSSHWYIIPNELYDDFFKDSENEDLIDSGKFDDKYGKYRTGGDLNNKQLYSFV